MDTRYNAHHKRVKNHFKYHTGPPRTRKDVEKHDSSFSSKKDRDPNVNKHHNKLIAEETLEILEKGLYTYTPTSEAPEVVSGSDHIVTLTDMLNFSKTNTIEYTDEQSLALSIDTADFPEIVTEFQVELETTLSGIEQLNSDGYNVVALNFASARNPGGGFIKGANAQEESLVRSSGLYHCIKDGQLYAVNEADNQNCLYSHQMIYSPDVPIFRDDSGDLLSASHQVAFITCPAVNANQAKRRVKNPKIIDQTMYERLDRILAVARYHKHNAIVLGAYGCGVFGNDIETVGEMFQDLLCDKYQNVFEVVRFSVLDQDHYDVLHKLFVIE